MAQQVVHMTKEKRTTLTIALDVMGGDHAPHAVLEAANRIASEDSSVRFLLYGDESRIKPIVRNMQALALNATIFHSEKVVEPDMKPTTAVRHGKDTSMFMSIRAVREGKADAVVSAGNTGALMAISKICLGTLEGIDRPAIATALPSVKDPYVMLDLGANVECTARHLFQFAIMGDAFSKSVFRQPAPRIGLLNIGSEDMKGRENIQEAAELLRTSALSAQFIGNVEAHELADGKVDVAVTDGFTGNVALKAIEGTGTFCKSLLKRAFTSSILSRLAYLLAKPALKTMFNRIDPRNYNGAMFVGLNGIVVKSHGFADELAYANAIRVAIRLKRNNVNELIISELEASDTNPLPRNEEQEASEIASAIAMS